MGVTVDVDAGGDALVGRLGLALFLCSIAGSSAVQIGTLNFIDPSAPGKIVKQLEEYCEKMAIEKISSLTASYIL